MPVLLALLALVQTDWKPYTLDGFGVSLPSPPVEQKPPEAPIRVQVWGSPHNGQNGISIVTLTVPPSKDAFDRPDAFFNGEIAATLAQSGGKLIAETDHVVQGWPALDYEVEASGTVGLTRAVIVDRHVVQILVIGPSRKAVRPPFDRVVASLRLPVNTPKGPLVAPGPVFSRQKLGESPATVEMPGEPKTHDQKINDSPDAPVAHVFASPYANRMYVAQYVDVPGEAPPMPEEEDPSYFEFLRGVNDGVVGSFKAKAVSSEEVRLDGAPALRTHAKIGDTGSLRIETVYGDGRIYTLVSVVPAIWKDHPEVKRYFGSFRFAAPEPPKPSAPEIG